MQGISDALCMPLCQKARFSISPPTPSLCTILDILFVLGIPFVLTGTPYGTLKRNLRTAPIVMLNWLINNQDNERPASFHYILQNRYSLKNDHFHVIILSQISHYNIYKLSLPCANTQMLASFQQKLFDIMYAIFNIYHGPGRTGCESKEHAN